MAKFTVPWTKPANAPETKTMDMKIIVFTTNHVFWIINTNS